MTKFIFSILVIIAIALLVFLFDPYSFNLNNNFVSTTTSSSEPPESVIPTEALTIDFEQYTVKDMVERVHDGDAELLLWVDVSHGKPTVYLFNSVESLAKYSKDKTAYLDISNPAFFNLALGRLDYDNKILYYTSIRNSGIAAINIDPAYLSSEILSDPRRYDQVAGKVVYSDSSSRVMRVVILPGGELQGVTLQRTTKLR